MERFSQRESVLLGYSPQRIFTNNHPIFHSPDNSPDIDFNDVFGGPPRRVSIQETRYSFGDYNDANSPSYALTSTANAHHAQRWSGLGEKPVFGEESSNSNRRRYTNSDFFDDIFKGSESVSSSPRKSDRDSFSLSSRVLSPAPSLPPRASDPPLPAQFSLPARLIKGTDLPTFGSSGRHHHKDGSSNGVSFYSQSPLSRFSNQVQEDVSLHKSTSQEFSVSSGESWSTAKPDETDKSNNSTKDSTNSVGTNSNSNFHFSIYKWASKGVPLGFPTRGGNSSKLKEKTKLERSSSASGRIVYQGMTKELHTVTSQDTGSLPFSNNISSDDKPSEIELDKKGNGLLHPTSTINGTKDKGLNVEGAVLRKIVPETVSDSSGNISLHDSKGVSKTLPNAARGKAGKGDDNSKITRDNSKTDLRTLHSLISGDEEKTIKIESKESKVKHTKKSAAVFDVDEKVKKQNEESIRLNGKDRDEKSNSPRNSQDGLTKNRSRGKVKEFVKIFNQESSKKPTVNAEPQNRSSRWKKKPKANPDDVSNVTKPDKKTQLPNGNKSHKQDPPAKVDGFLKQFDKQHFEPRADNYLNATDISSGLEDKSATTAAPIPDGSEAGDSDYSFQENILIKELPQDDELPEATDNQDEYQFIDVKIRKWSNGKEGNIRSLLSTLQYVLWPGSGWKPVPLVDIIEGNAVKRSYQKALLSLHPDKLQQKGATSQQKYIAEKVFDILQEAWTHFSSLDSV